MSFASAALHGAKRCSIDCVWFLPHSSLPEIVTGNRTGTTVSGSPGRLALSAIARVSPGRMGTLAGANSSAVLDTSVHAPLLRTCSMHRELHRERVVGIHRSHVQNIGRLHRR